MALITDPKIKKKINVELHLGRSSSNLDGGYFYLEVKDKSSSTMILDIKIPLDLVPDFFSNRNIGWDREIPAEFYNSYRIGKFREAKTFSLQLLTKGQHPDKPQWELDCAIAVWKNENSHEGWEAHGSDCDWNSKRWHSKTGTYDLHAVRYVDKEKAPEGALP
jgi:hypothetical protein